MRHYALEPMRNNIAYYDPYRSRQARLQLAAHIAEAEGNPFDRSQIDGLSDYPVPRGRDGTIPGNVTIRPGEAYAALKEGGAGFRQGGANRVGRLRAP